MEICLNLEYVKEQIPEFYLKVVRQVFKDTCFLKFEKYYFYKFNCRTV